MPAVKLRESASQTQVSEHRLQQLISLIKLKMLLMRTIFAMLISAGLQKTCCDLVGTRHVTYICCQDLDCIVALYAVVT